MRNGRQQVFSPEEIRKERVLEDGSIGVDFFAGADILGCQEAMYDRMLRKDKPVAVTTNLNGFAFRIQRL